MKVLWVLAVLLVTCSARDSGSRVSVRRSPEDNKDEDRREIAPAVPHLNSPHYLRRRATTVLYDDFSSGRINPQIWEHTINAGFYPDNHHFQMYTPEPVNTYVRNGVLYIRPTLTVDTFGTGFLTTGDINARERWGDCSHGICHTHGWNSVHPIMSGMLRSKVNIRFGRVEIVAKMAKGDWFWNALWMMPVTSAYGGWPKSGEIDIIEAAGNRHYTTHNGNSVGIDKMGSSIHYGVDRDDHHVHETNDYRLHGTTFGDGFRTYWVDWTVNHINIGVDDHTVLAVRTPSQGYFQASHQSGPNIWASGGHSAPFDTPFNLIMNVHVGGKPFHVSGWHNHPYERPWNPNSNIQMMQFWQNRTLWEPTWQGETAAMQIRSVKMVQY